MALVRRSTSLATTEQLAEAAERMTRAERLKARVCAELGMSTAIVSDNTDDGFDALVAGFYR
jgi:hypothetical protein